MPRPLNEDKNVRASDAQSTNLSLKTRENITLDFWKERQKAVTLLACTYVDSDALAGRAAHQSLVHFFTYRL
jgi:hypothetical protein